MKLRFLLSIFVFLILLFFPKVALAQSGYVIDNFDSVLQIENTGELKVIETIDVDFSNVEKHGIFRDIPYEYVDNEGNKSYSEVKVAGVLQDGREATIKKSTNGGYINIRIGDANKTITGKHRYQIMYSVKGVLSSYKDFDELYWNITGNGWDAPISSATATVKLPTEALISAYCYQGPYSSAELCGSRIENPKVVKFWSTRPYAENEGMTIAAGFEKGTVPILVVERPKSFIERFFSSESLITILAATIAGIIAVSRLWIKNGRDFWYRGITGMLKPSTKDEVKPIGAHEPIVVEYTPPENLTPALVGVLVDEKADTLDVTATIIDLASKGFLTITEIPKNWIFGKVDYELHRTNKDDAKLLKYEKELLTRLFTKKDIKTSELKLTFYDDLAKVKTKLYEEAVNMKLFSEDPEKVRGKYMVMAIIIFIAGIFITVLSASVEIIITTDIGIAIIITGLLLLIFASFMPRRTAKGRELYRRIKGYRLFIDRAESYKQKFFENKNIFTEILPYTIIFGLTAKFAKAMKDIGLKPQNPSWYHSANAFNIANFSSSVNNFSSSMSNAIASSPSSSGSGGGGFSGGGGGGGGGGSW